MSTEMQIFLLNQLQRQLIKGIITDREPLFWSIFRRKSRPNKHLADTGPKIDDTFCGIKSQKKKKKAVVFVCFGVWSTRLLPLGRLCGFQRARTSSKAKTVKRGTHCTHTGCGQPYLQSRPKQFEINLIVCCLFVSSVVGSECLEMQQYCRWWLRFDNQWKVWPSASVSNDCQCKMCPLLLCIDVIVVLS